ncbi:MAG: hypothetical protein DRO39_01600 [Thermoprotei archaeon]|nr:MAG: hypothetical protein DRO39_01600 [Thermoprotei archaeon]
MKRSTKLLLATLGLSALALLVMWVALVLRSPVLMVISLGVAAAGLVTLARGAVERVREVVERGGGG